MIHLRYSNHNQFLKALQLIDRHGKVVLIPLTIKVQAGEPVSHLCLTLTKRTSTMGKVILERKGLWKKVLKLCRLWSLQHRKPSFATCIFNKLHFLLLTLDRIFIQQLKHVCQLKGIKVFLNSWLFFILKAWLSFVNHMKEKTSFGYVCINFEIQTFTTRCLCSRALSSPLLFLQYSTSLHSFV